MTRLLILLIVLATVPARADEPPPPPEAPEIADAKRHFDQGVALYNDGNFTAALAEFEEAYRLRPAAFVLYNVGLTQKALFRYSDAIAALQRFIDESTQLAPERRNEAEQLILEMKALLADVTVKVTPDKATITVDGRVAGVTPLAAPLQLAAGSHKVEVTAEGYEPQKKEVIVTAGVPLALAFQLVAIPKTGKVRIDTTTPRATIAIDGKQLGPAPVELELEPGGHLVEVAAPNHQTRRVDLVVVAGQARRLDLRLDKEKVIRPQARAWYQQWYVWTGVAAVLGGGAAVCGLAGCFDRPQGPVGGTLDPGAVVVP